jgi:Fe-S cluster assembly protein SufD
LTTRHDEHVERLAFVEKGGRMLWQEAVTGGTTFQANTRTVLVGERAEVVVESALLASGDEQCDVSHFVSHAAPETKSGIRVRAAACHRAKILHRGKVMIDEGMRGCAAFQREDVLLLSPQAEADAIPMLEVAEPDVCCGHASTIGRLDEEKLFYAMSRGIGRAEAEHMLVEAFFQPIVSSLRDEGVADDFRTSLFAKVSPL